MCMCKKKMCGKMCGKKMCEEKKTSAIKINGIPEKLLEDKDACEKLHNMVRFAIRKQFPFPVGDVFKSGEYGELLVLVTIEDDIPRIYSHSSYVQKHPEQFRIMNKFGTYIALESDNFGRLTSSYDFFNGNAEYSIYYYSYS